jgi:hypothetical protein
MVPYENDLIANPTTQNPNRMKTETNSARDVPAFKRASRSAIFVTTFIMKTRRLLPIKNQKSKFKIRKTLPFSKHFKGFQREIFANEIWLSPTQSRPVQPNPTNPLGYEPLSD